MLCLEGVMGCQGYGVVTDGMRLGGSEVWLRFNEDVDDVGCLCTFDPEKEVLCPSRMASLAMLGAAVLMAHNRKDVHWGDAFSQLCIPDALPEKLRASMAAFVAKLDSDA